LGLHQGLTPFSLTRLAFDFALPGGLTLGGGFGFTHSSNATETEGGGVTLTDDGLTTTDIVLAPRVGYWFELTPLLALWPRGGLSLASSSTSTDATDRSEQLLALTLDVPLVITPVPRLGILIAPSLDAGRAHWADVNGNDHPGDVSTFQLRLQLGFLVAL